MADAQQRANESMADSRKASNQGPTIWSWVMHGYCVRIHEQIQSATTSACFCGIATACHITVPRWSGYGIALKDIAAIWEFTSFQQHYQFDPI